MNTTTRQAVGRPSDAQLRDAIDGHLRTIANTVRHQQLQEAVTHAALQGGKRIRPLLALRCCALAGSDPMVALPAGCGFELIHAFSLVHDDLPALDDDEMRRGLPTVHKAFGESIGILCGDLLQSLAFETIASSPHPMEVLLELSRATNAMIEGQAWDTDGGFPEGLDEAERLELIHRNKTGALIRGAARAGAIAGGADDSTLDCVDRWSSAVGLMFQVVDDLLDETQSSEHLGKAAGKDREAGKLTFPGVHGLEGARKTVIRLEDVANEALAGFSEVAAPLRDLTHDLAKRTR
ncbi:MAG: polyprenyl synthetase family protein [Phycisphaerales bacterium]|jgi:geranylgeranyl diphosphate synthase type II|nr:polyprenyl synthetase family protein [Phycisphaerales bacterium]